MTHKSFEISLSLQNNVQYCFKEIRLKIGFVEEMRNTDLTEIIKRFANPCTAILFIRRHKFNLFDNVSLATPRFEISWHQKRINSNSYYVLSPHLLYAVLYLILIKNSKKSFVRKAYCESLHEINFAESHFQIYAVYKKVNSTQWWGDAKIQICNH